MFSPCTPLWQADILPKTQRRIEAPVWNGEKRSPSGFVNKQANVNGKMGYIGRLLFTLDVSGFEKRIRAFLIASRYSGGNVP